MAFRVQDALTTWLRQTRAQITNPAALRQPPTVHARRVMAEKDRERDLAQFRERPDDLARVTRLELAALLVQSIPSTCLSRRRTNST